MPEQGVNSSYTESLNYGASSWERHSAGVVPDHRLNERMNVLASVYPSAFAIPEIGVLLLDNNCRATP
jgi:hypothetical protein